ncbi:MAG: hypothetical protein WD009_13025 [Phycisphaeraceae bacterium]
MSTALATTTVAPTASQQAMIGWQYPLPAWVWALIILAAFAAALWSYSRLLGPPYARLALAALRGLVILFVAALLAGPVLVRVDERIEPDVLLVLLDRSASMQIRDAPDPTNPGRLISRDERLRRALAGHADLFTDEHRRVVWLGFGGDAYDLPLATDDTWPAADQPTTRLRTAIEQALAAAAGAPVSGIVLLTDGRSPEPTAGELVHRLQQQAVGVYSVPFGADPLPLDLRLADLHHPDEAFSGDVVPVTATIERRGGAGPVDPAAVRLRLTDRATGDTLQETTLADAGGDFGQPVRLAASTDRIGLVHWDLEVLYDRDDEPLLDTGRRRAELPIEMLDRPLRVLYVEGYPRWEYRYLASLLVREDSIRSSMMLLSADRGFAQEGDEPIARLPNSNDEIAPFDVVILGDVAPSQLSPGQMELIRDQVAQRGAGLLWIGGDRDLPGNWDAAPLADLLPMRRPGSVTRVTHAGGRVQLAPTDAARQLGILTLRGPASDATGWPAELPELRWAQDVGPLKPATAVLAEAVGEDVTTVIPLLLQMRYGAGQVLYLATDETWRWRYGRGELYFEQFWLQLVRTLGRQRVQQAGDRARLSVSQRRIELGQDVTVELTLSDPALLENPPRRVTVAVHQLAAVHEQLDPDRDETDAPELTRLELRPRGGGAGGSGGGGGGGLVQRYEATWRPGQGGELELRVADADLADLGLTRRLEVVAPDDEMRRPEPDHDRLTALAEQTQGAIVTVDELHRIGELVPNRARRVPLDEREPLWNTSLSLIVVLLLLSAEWVGRKLIRLV